MKCNPCDLSQARGVRSALVNKLYCTDVCYEWVSCLHSASIFWNSFQETEITTISQMMLAAMSSNSFAVVKLATAKLKMPVARSLTKWTKACDNRLSRLISYIHYTCEYKQYCYVGNTAKQCRLGLFQDSEFAGDLEDSKSTSGGTLCVFGSHTFVPKSWMCKKQTSVSHSSTESEIISLDARLRLDGIPALDLWDLIVCSSWKHDSQPYRNGETRC